MNYSKNLSHIIRITFFLLFCLNSNALWGQKLKTYSDDSELYTYYKDSVDNTIKHGTYKAKFKPYGGNEDVVTEYGNYIYGKKDGLWSIREDINSVVGELTKKGYEKNTATFSNGILNGAWYYKVSIKGVFYDYNYITKTKKVNFRYADIYSVKMNFKNGIICGGFELSDSCYNLNSSVIQHESLDFNQERGIQSSFEGKITGQFNIMGLMDGKWSFENGKFIAIFMNGILIKQSAQTLTSKGKYIDKEQNEDLIITREKFAKKEISEEEVNKKGYKINTYLLFNNCNKGLFGSDIICQSENYGKYIFIEKQ